MMNLPAFFLLLLKKEFILASRQKSILFYAALFFLMMMVFFPLTLPAAGFDLKPILPGLSWMALLLSMILTAEGLFSQDYEDAVIEQWIVSSYPLSLFVLAKLLVHWFMGLLPILLFCPLLALLYELCVYEVTILSLSLICGSAAILCLCAMASVFSTSLQQKGVLMTLIILPLSIPIMVFGSAAVNAAIQGLPVSGHLAILAAVSLLCLGFLPATIAALIRVCLVD